MERSIVRRISRNSSALNVVMKYGSPKEHSIEDRRMHTSTNREWRG